MVRRDQVFGAQRRQHRQLAFRDSTHVPILSIPASNASTNQKNFSTQLVEFSAFKEHIVEVLAAIERTGTTDLWALLDLLNNPVRDWLEQLIEDGRLRSSCDGAHRSASNVHSFPPTIVDTRSSTLLRSTTATSSPSTSTA